MTDASRAAAGWYPDPPGRHEHRYWDGNGWTLDVADAGVTGIDQRVRATMAEQGATPAPATTSAATAPVAASTTPAPAPTVAAPVTTAPMATATPPAAPLPGLPLEPTTTSTRPSRRRTRSLQSAVIVAVAAIAGFLVANYIFSGNDSAQHDYPASIEANFVSSCIQGGGTRDTCRCALSNIEEEYDLGQFSDATREYDRTGVLPDKMKNATLSCLSEPIQEN
jgi:hypothetical protein